jgi:hypothetical protein
VALRRGSRAAIGRRSRRAALVLKWPVGLANVFWRYLWRTTPMHRCEADGDTADLPGPVPAPVHDSDVQAVEDGVGPLWHRRFTVVIDGVDVALDSIIAPLARDPNWAVPAELAVFEKTHGRTGVLAVGDEFVVRCAGTWKPVRSSSGCASWTATCTWKSKHGPGRVTACRTCSTTISGWPRRSS